MDKCAQIHTMDSLHFVPVPLAALAVPQHGHAPAGDVRPVGSKRAVPQLGLVHWLQVELATRGPTPSRMTRTLGSRAALRAHTVVRTRRWSLTWPHDSVVRQVSDPMRF